MKSKKLIAIIATVIMIFTIVAGVALKVNAAPEAAGDETMLTLEDEGLYNAIVENLEKMEGIEEFDKCNGFNYYNDDKGYIIVKTADILRIDTLNLSGYGIKSLIGIGGFINIINLDVSKNELKSLNGIQNLTKLENLQAENNIIQEISVLVNKTTIKVLNLNNNDLDDTCVAALETLTGLTNLGIANNNLTGVGNIKNFGGLEELRIGGIDYTKSTNDLQNLGSLTNLKVLSVSGIKLAKEENQIEEPSLNISFIEDLSELEELDISFNNINDLSNLSIPTNTKLTSLNVYGNSLDDEDINTIASINGLISLNMGANSLTEIGNISNLTNLEFLNLKGNELKSIEGIESLTKLEELYLEENKLEDIDYSKFANLKNVYFAKQTLSRSVEGLYGETKTIELPAIFAQAKAWALANEKCNESNFAEKYLELSNCELSEDGTSILVDPFNVANSGGYIKILSGITEEDENQNQEQDKQANIYEGTILNIYGTSMLYEEDITTDDMITDLLTALLKSANTTLDDFDMNKFEDYFKEVNVEGLLEEDDKLYKVIDEYMDFNLDGRIDYQDYNRLYAYKMGNIDFLYTAFTALSHKVNNDIIAQIITTDKNVELKGEESIHRFTENGSRDLVFYKGDNQMMLTAKVTTIDKVAPVAGKPEYIPTYGPTGQNVESVTVTITAINKDIENIYNFEENETQGNEEDDETLGSGWSLGEDNRTITKVFKENAEEEVIMQDAAGNITTVTVNVNNITETEIDSDNNNEG